MRVLQKRKQSPVTAESSVPNVMVASSPESEFIFKEGLHPFNHSYKKYIIE